MYVTEILFTLGFWTPVGTFDNHAEAKSVAREWENKVGCETRIVKKGN